MNNQKIRTVVEQYLSKQFFCTDKQLSQEGICFTKNTKSQQTYLKVLSYKASTIVNASEDIFLEVKEMLQGKNRDEVFEYPIVYGQTIHYVPDVNLIEEPEFPLEYTYELLEGNELMKLQGIKGFDNSLVFDNKGNTSTQIVFVAKKGEDVIGIAGAGVVTDTMWEVGIDVKEEYRNGGLGSKLVKKLTLEILKKGIVPFYSASVTNVGSQMVASRVGYIPCWVDTFGNIFDEYYAYDIEAVIGNLKEIHNDCINCSTCKKSSDR